MSKSINLSYYDSEETLGREIACMFENWTQARNVWANRVKEVIQYVYATSTRETSNEANGWSHSTHIPKLTQIHDNLGANYAGALLGGRDFFTFEPANIDEASVEKRKAVVAYLNTKHDQSGFEQVIRQLLDDWVQTGNCFARVEYVRETATDPRTGAEIVQYEGPRVKRISPYDIVFDHTAESFQKSAKIFRMLVSKGDLMRRMEEVQGEDYDLDEVERMMAHRNHIGGMKDAAINKEHQAIYDGFSTAASYYRSGKIELLEFVGDIYNDETGELEKDMIITVADRQYVIRKQKMQDYQGFGKMYHSGWRKRPDNLWAQGPLDNLVGMQYLINHLENARADAFDQMLSPDRVHVGQVQVSQDGPVTNYYIDDGNGSVSNLAPDATVLNADLQISTKENQMEAYAGAPREAMGIRTAGEKTAFEVQALQNAASRLFQTRTEQFEREFLEPILNGELEIAVLNLSGIDVAKVLDDDEGVLEFMSISVDDLTVRGRLKARGASHFAKRAQLVQELQQFSQIIMQDQSMAIHFPAKVRAKAWSEALQLDKLKLYQPFGQIDENTEAQQAQQAAQSVQDESQAAAMGIQQGEVSGDPMEAMAMQGIEPEMEDAGELI